MMQKNIEVILFDLGGVLIELTGVPRLQEWSQIPMSVEQLWEKWIRSSAAREFESGKINAEEFSQKVVDEFQLTVSSSQYLSEFIYWPKALFNGAAFLLEKASKCYRLASLSNTNPLHWNRFITEMKLLDYITINFPSHITGLLKPDAEAYQNVIQTLNIDAQKILFLDDNQINVDGATKQGMQALCVKGLKETSDVLKRFGVE